MQNSHNKVGSKFKSRSGVTYEIQSACGAVYVTCNDNFLGNPPESCDCLYEVFIRLGKAGGCASALNESVGKLISHYLQIGGDVNVVLKSLSGVSCCNSSSAVPSCIAATVEAIKEHLNLNEKGE